MYLIALNYCLHAKPEPSQLADLGYRYYLAIGSLQLSISFLLPVVDQSNLGNIRLELASRNAVLKHLLDLGVVAALEFGQAEVEVDAHGHRETEEDEADLATEVGLVGVDEVGHDLGDEAGEGGRDHDVDTVGLLSELNTEHVSFA